MKPLITILFLCCTVVGFTQSFYVSPLQSQYLKGALHHSSIIATGEQPYNGLGKHWLMNSTSGRVINHAAPMGLDDGVFGVMQKNIFPGYYTPIQASAFGSSLGEWNLLFKTGLQLGKFKSAWLVDYKDFQQQVDKNEDGFLDLPTRRQVLLGNSWLYNLNERFYTTLQAYYLQVNELGGEASFDKDTDYLTTNAYGMGHEVTNSGFTWTNELKIGKITQKKHLNFGIDGKLHQQQSFYGLKEYTGDEQVLNATLTYHDKNPFDEYHIGLRYRHHEVEESYYLWAGNRKENIISGFFNYQTQLYEQLTLKSFLTLDRHNLLGWQFKPSLKIDYFIENTGNIMLFSSRDVRYTNVFTEYSGMLMTGRDVVIPEMLDAERAWQFGGGLDLIDQTPYWLDLTIASTKIIWYQVWYQNMIVLDYNADQEQLLFLNYNDNTRRNVFEVMTGARWKGIYFNFLYRKDLPTFKQGDETRYFPLFPENTYVYQLSYRPSYGFSMSLSYINQSSQYLPVSDSWSPNNHRLDFESTFTLGAYTSAPILEKMVVFVKGENLTNYRQNELIINSESPFGKAFEGGMVWGNSVGFRVSGGFTVKF